MKLFGRKSTDAEAIERKTQEEFQETINGRFGFIKTDPQTETYYNGNLMMVGAHLTQVCHPNGGTPDQIVNSYIQVMGKLTDWFNLVPLREKLEGMLEEKVWSEWSVKEQPVVPAYTPYFLRNRCTDGTGEQVTNHPSNDPKK